MTNEILLRWYLLVILLQPALQNLCASSAAASTDPITSTGSFSQQYTQLTKNILLTGIEVERFSLNFRMESAKQPKFRKLRYFVSQEAGSAGGLAFEVTGVDQFGKGRKRPLQIDKRALHGALAATTTTSIIAGAGSVFELSSNVVQMIKNKRKGYDSHSATKYVSAKLRHIDELLAQREALVAANTDSPSYARAVAEGKVLHALRSAFLNEYSHFNANTSAYRTYQNLFYILNASYNSVGAMAANVAYRAVDRPHLNGTANILFIVSGGMAMVTPVLCQAAGLYAQKRAYASVKKEMGPSDFNPDQFALDCKNLEAMGSTGEGTLIASLPATQRFALYTQSNDLFTKQLDSETKTMRKLEKVALQNSYLGPVIGSTLMTQGILGTYGYYHYPLRIRKQIGQYYCGAIVGTVGTSMAVVGNAASLLGTLAYEHKLAKQKRLPLQLIKERLTHLDELEKLVSIL
jgi:hypothetical protein